MNERTARGMPSPGACWTTPRQTATKAITRSSVLSWNVGRTSTGAVGASYGLRGEDGPDNFGRPGSSVFVSRPDGSRAWPHRKQVVASGRFEAPHCEQTNQI